MSRIHLPLLPLPVLAVVVAFSACSRPRSDDPATHVIPPAAPFVASAVPATGPGEPGAPKAKPAAADPAPSANDVKEFERPVRK